MSIEVIDGHVVAKWNLGGGTSLLRHTKDMTSLLNGEKWLQVEVVRLVDVS